MALFSCNGCKSLYADYYPPDDTCIKCHTGTIRIIEEPITDTSTITHKEEDQ